MAHEPQRQLPSKPFPGPPPFWKFFTTTNIARLEQFKSFSDVDAPAQLPLDLIPLRPPAPPESAASYTSFSQTIPLVRTTSSASAAIPNSLLHSTDGSSESHQLLFDPNDSSLNHQDLLKRLARSLLLNFLEFSVVMSLNPSEWEVKLSDLKRILENMNVLINMYRPHQARESLILWLEDMVEQGEEEIRKSDRVKEKVEQFLKNVGGGRRRRRRRRESRRTNRESHDSAAVQWTRERSRRRSKTIRKS